MTNSADVVKHRDAEDCDSHQVQRDGPWVWIESERDSEPYGSRESTIVQVRLAHSLTHVGLQVVIVDTMTILEQARERAGTIQVDAPLRIARHGPVPGAAKQCIGILGEDSRSLTCKLEE